MNNAKQHATEEQYYAWVATEPLSDPCVDVENVGPNDGSPDYWDRMLAAGKSAVQDRKDEQRI